MIDDVAKTRSPGLQLLVILSAATICIRANSECVSVVDINVANMLCNVPHTSHSWPLVILVEHVIQN